MKSTDLKLIKCCIENTESQNKNRDIVKLASDLLEMAEREEVVSLSLIAVHSDNRVSNTTAGDIKYFKSAINAGIINQLFALNQV